MTVSRTRPEPLYHQVIQEVRRRIDAGQWRPGDRLPSERQLGEMLGVSRITVRHAIRLAVTEGLLHQRSGVGTFVGEPDRVEQDLSSVRSFERTLAQQGQIASTEIEHSGVVVGELSLAGTLRVGAADPVYSLRLLGWGDSCPVVFYDSYFDVDLGRQVAEAASRMRDAGQPFSTLDLYREGEVGRVPTILNQTFEAMVAPVDLAERLDVDPGAALLAVESVMSDDEGPLEFRRAHYRADRYKFAIQRRLGVGH